MIIIGKNALFYFETLFPVSALTFYTSALYFMTTPTSWLSHMDVTQPKCLLTFRNTTGLFWCLSCSQLCYGRPGLWTGSLLPGPTGSLPALCLWIDHPASFWILLPGQSLLVMVPSFMVLFGCLDLSFCPSSQNNHSTLNWNIKDPFGSILGQKKHENSNFR